MNNLNDHLQPTDSPIDTKGSISTSKSFNWHQKRNAITGTRIKNFNFSQGFGGTLTLGGTENGNGMLIIENDTGGTAVIADNTGITIYDTEGSVILDPRGVMSLSQFQSFTLNSGGTVYTTTSTSFTDVPGSSFSIVQTERSARVLFNVFINAFAANFGWIHSGYAVNAQLYDSFLGAAAMGGLYTTGNAATYVTFPGPGTTTVTERIASQAVTLSAILDVAPGTHNYKLQYSADGGGTAELDFFEVNGVILGT